MIYLATCVNIDNGEVNFYYSNGKVYLFLVIDKNTYIYSGSIDDMLGYKEKSSYFNIEFVLPETKRYIIYRRELSLIIEQIIFEKI